MNMHSLFIVEFFSVSPPPTMPQIPMMSGMLYMFEPMMFPSAMCDDPKPTANKELSNSGKAVTKATNTVPTTTRLMLKHEDNPEAPLTTRFEPQ